MFDAVTLAAVADELNETIVRGRVQEVVQLDALAVGLEIYAQHRRHYLYLSAHPDEARVHLVAAKLRGGSVTSPLLLLLRKYVKGAFVDSISPLPHERVLLLRFDHSTEGVSTLVVETIGRYANLILLDAAGIVLEAAKRVPAAINRARVILPKHRYVPPPPQAKLDPSALTVADLARTLAENRGAPLWQTLVKTIAGVSPLLAREIQQRVSSDPAPERVWKTLGELVRAPWHPTVAYAEGEPAAFASYPLTQFAETRAFDSMSAAIEAFYGTPESYAAAKEPLRAQLEDARDKLARKRDALAQSLPSPDEIERWRARGELILAYAHQISTGQAILVAEMGDTRMEIPLDPRLSAVENAQACFKEYRRAKDAAARVPALLAAAQVELDYAEQMLNDLEFAESRAEIEAIARAAYEAGLIGGHPRRARALGSEPRVFRSRDGFTILVGRNARQNDEITFRRARPDDLWLHVRALPGAHVVIVRAGRNVPETTIAEAAALARRYSQARDDSHAQVIVTSRRYVHRLRGGKPGMVTVRGGQSYLTDR